MSNYKIALFDDIVDSAKKLIQLQLSKNKLVIVNSSTENEEFLLDFNDDVVNHLYEIINIPKSFLKQFVSLNQLIYLMRDFPTDIKVRIGISKHSIFYLISNNMYRNNRIDIVNLSIKNNDVLDYEMFLTNSHKQFSASFDFDAAYEHSFNSIKSKLNPNITDMKSLMHYLKNDSYVLMGEEANKAGMSYIPYNCIPAEYKTLERVDDFRNDHFYRLQYTQFASIVKKFLPKDTFKEFNQVLSIMQFYYNLAHIKKANYIDICFVKPLKLQSFNGQFILTYESNPNISLELFSDGSFYYSNPILDVPVYLEELNDIYDHYMKLITQLLSNRLGMDSSKITVKDVDLFMMMTY